MRAFKKSMLGSSEPALGAGREGSADNSGGSLDPRLNPAPSTRMNSCCCASDHTEGSKDVVSAILFSRSARCLPAEPDTGGGREGSGNSGGSSPTNVLAVTVFEVMGDSMCRKSSKYPLNENTRPYTPVLMYVTSSPRAELVNLDNLSVPLLRMAFLRASARACAVDIVVVVVVVRDKGMG